MEYITLKYLLPYDSSTSDTARAEARKLRCML